MGATAGILYGLKSIYDYTQSNKQASAASQQGDYEATALRQNAALADQQAADAISRGQVEEGRVKLDTTQRIGSTKAALASQGVDVGSGSALDVQASEAGLGALDQLTVRNNAAREAWGYNVQATDLRNQATMAQVGGARAAAGYKAQGVSALLSGAAQEVGLYSSLKRMNDTDKTDERGGQYKTSPGPTRRRSGGTSVPQVPYLSQPRVSPNALPGVRRSVNAPIEAFGGGVAAQQIDLSGPANVAGNIAQQNALDRQRIRSEAALEADQVAVTHATSAVQNEVNARMYGPDGLMRRSGKNAFTIDQEAYDFYGELVANTRAQLGTDRQRAVFDKYAYNGWDALVSQFTPHIARERENFDKEGVDASLQASLTAAIAAPTNPVVVEKAVSDSMAVTASRAGRLGLPEEAVKAAVADAGSNVHLAVIKSMLSQPDIQNRDELAKAYFDTHKDGLIAKDSLEAKRLIERQSAEGDAVRMADQIILQSQGDELKQLDLVAQIKDATLRVDTEKRLSFVNAQRAAANRRNQEKAAFKGYTKLEHNNWDTTSIPQSLREEMGLSHWENLVNAATKKTNEALRGGPGDREKTTQLINESYLDPDKFLARNIDTEEGLNYAEKARLIAMQKSGERVDLAPLTRDLRVAQTDAHHYKVLADRADAEKDTETSATNRSLQAKAEAEVSRLNDQIAAARAAHGRAAPPISPPSATAPLTVPANQAPGTKAMDRPAPYPSVTSKNPLGLEPIVLKKPPPSLAVDIANAKALGMTDYLDLARSHGWDVDGVPPLPPETPAKPAEKKPTISKTTVKRGPDGKITDTTTTITKPED